MTQPMNDFLFELPDLRHTDYSAHNQYVESLWAGFREGTHERIPFRLNTNPRVLMLDPWYNKRGITYKEYMTDPEVMGQALLEWQFWKRFLLPGDHEKGIPERWINYIDLQNFYDAAWFGCPVCYRDGQVPDTEPILTEDKKNYLFDRGIPDPFAGEWAERALSFWEYFKNKSQAGWTFLGAPVDPPMYVPFTGCDGVMTIAASLRGATELCMDLLIDPDYARQLLEFIHQAVMARMEAWRLYTGMPVPQDGFGSADDSIQLISSDQYQEFILPLHRQLYDRFATGKDRAMHLCGNSQRHFSTIKNVLGVNAFDTGFPVDFARLRRDLGPEVLISGGPQIGYFLQEDPAPAVAEAERILTSGILTGGRFILQEGNNLPPCARLPVCQAVYESCQRLGKVR